jgi:hypothetical protein
MNNKILETNIEIALEHANKLGADQTEASCSNGKGFSVQAQNESAPSLLACSRAISIFVSSILLFIFIENFR